MKIEYSELMGAYENLVKSLNAAGAEGWDVVSLSVKPDINSFRAIMKRKKGQK